MYPVKAHRWAEGDLNIILQNTALGPCICTSSQLQTTEFIQPNLSRRHVFQGVRLLCYLSKCHRCTHDCYTGLVEGRAGESPINNFSFVLTFTSVEHQMHKDTFTTLKAVQVIFLVFRTRERVASLLSALKRHLIRVKLGHIKKKLPHKWLQ